MSLEIDASGWLGMIHELSRISGKEFEHILLPQVGALLKNCIAHTPARKKADIVKRISKNSGHVEFNDGTIISRWKKADVDMFLDTSTYKEAGWPKKSGVPTLRNGKTWHDMTNRRWSNERWAKFIALESKINDVLLDDTKRKKRIDESVAARGLAKKSWLQIATDLGLDPGIAPAYVQNAKDPKGREFKEGLGLKLLETAALIIEISNSNPLMVGKLKGAAILANGMHAREKAFQIDMQHGVFEDLKRRAQRYPGIFVS